MLMDVQNLFSDKQSLVGAVGNINGTNAIDLGVAGTIISAGGSPTNDPGRGDPPEVVAQVTSAVTSGANIATVQAQLVSADSADLLTNPTVLEQSAAIGVAALVPGYRFRLGSVPPGVNQRYLGIRFVIAGEATTAGAATAGLVIDDQETFVG